MKTASTILLCSFEPDKWWQYLFWILTIFLAVLAHFWPILWPIFLPIFLPKFVKFSKRFFVLNFFFKIKKKWLSSFFWLETTPKNVTSRFHTMFGSRDTNFWLKSAFLGPNFSRTEICTANPKVVGCVQHYSTHFIKKLGKSLDPFFHKVQKTEKGPKRATNLATKCWF